MLNYSNTKVTLELRDVLATTDDRGQPFKLWDFDYPSYYKGSEKEAFEQKVIDHYYFQQIGVETIARFKHNFKTRMREIMPYYLQMYKSVEIMNAIEDPFGNVDIVETFEQETSESSTGSSSGSSSGSSTNNDHETRSSNETATKTDEKLSAEDSDRRFSNTPQGSIDNIDNYLTEASKDSRDQSETINSSGTVTTGGETINEGTATSTATTTGTSETENSGTVKHTLTRKGNQGVNTYAHDMIEYRQSFIDVDMLVIGALRDLFLFVY